MKKKILQKTHWECAQCTAKKNLEKCEEIKKNITQFGSPKWNKNKKKKLFYTKTFVVCANLIHTELILWVTRASFLAHWKLVLKIVWKMCAQFTCPTIIKCNVLVHILQGLGLFGSCCCCCWVFRLCALFCYLAVFFFFFLLSFAANIFFCVLQTVCVYFTYFIHCTFYATFFFFASLRSLLCFYFIVPQHIRTTFTLYFSFGLWLAIPRYRAVFVWFDLFLVVVLA